MPGREYDLIIVILEMTKSVGDNNAKKLEYLQRMSELIEEAEKETV